MTAKLNFVLNSGSNGLEKAQNAGMISLVFVWTLLIIFWEINIKTNFCGVPEETM